MKKIKLLIAVTIISGAGIISSCRYLDIVPDNIATIDYAFRLRNEAKKYLYTCYSYLPGFADWSSNPAMTSGEEVWFFYPYTVTLYGKIPVNWEIARGNQNIVNPYLNYWDGENGGNPMFQAIRDCNTFLENIDKVPDMQLMEKERWRAEVKFLKAYYHWYLLRMYGPIPVMDVNLPVSAGVEEVKFYRQPADSCFNYIVDLIDTAALNLPDVIQDPVSEMGRITRPIALSIKARILMNAASPLFNGNNDYKNFIDNKGSRLFNTTYDPAKWQRAADACREAIALCQSVGHQLYQFNPSVDIYKLGPEMVTRMNLRNAITEKWNAEIIWGANNSMVSYLQRVAQPILDPNANIVNGDKRPFGEYAPPIQIAEQFYTENGVPIDEDKNWNYSERYELKTATEDDKFNIKPGYVSARLNFNREPRFYAALGFDGGIWYGQGRYDDEDTWHVEGRLGGVSGKRRDGEHSITGYYTKKLVNFLNVLQSDGTYNIQAYPWPVIRLADLYLYYSEALNEVEGPTTEALYWINEIRKRAGIPSVEDAWTNYSVNPNAYKTKEGFREIIHQERLIEMAFEGNRYWDLRRWKEIEQKMNQPVRGWDVSQQEERSYYQLKILFSPTFKKRDYFWPIKEQSLIVNKNLVQNPGW